MVVVAVAVAEAVAMIEAELRLQLLACTILVLRSRRFSILKVPHDHASGTGGRRGRRYDCLAQRRAKKRPGRRLSYSPAVGRFAGQASHLSKHAPRSDPARESWHGTIAEPLPVPLLFGNLRQPTSPN